MEQITALVQAEVNNQGQSVSVWELQPENLAKLTKAEQIYYLAKKTPVLVELKENELWNRCNEVIVKTFVNLNKDMASPAAINEMKSLTIILRDLLIKTPKYSGMTVEDLNLAFEYGIRGEYGQFFGLNLQTFAQWIKGYEMDEIRRSALRKVAAARDTEMGFKVEVKEVTDQDMAQCVLNDLHTLKSGGNITGFKIFYDWCWRKFEEFKPSDDDRNMTIGKIKARTMNDLRMKRVEKYANSEVITKEIQKLEKGLFDEDFWGLCKIEHYKTYLTNSPMMFEKKLEEILNK